MNDMIAVTIYTKPGCFGCRKTEEKFADAGVALTIVDITENDAAREYVVEELGYMQAPVVVVEDGTGQDHWSGLNPTEIDRIIQANSR